MDIRTHAQYQLAFLPDEFTIWMPFIIIGGEEKHNLIINSKFLFQHGIKIIAGYKYRFRWQKNHIHQSCVAYQFPLAIKNNNPSINRRIMQNRQTYCRFLIKMLHPLSRLHHHH